MVNGWPHFGGVAHLAPWEYLGDDWEMIMVNVGKLELTRAGCHPSRNAGRIKGCLASRAYTN